MSVINVPSMKGYTPELLNGNFVGQVDEVKPSSGDKGYTIFMTLVEAAKSCETQPWQGRKVMKWFGTDMDQAKDPFQRRSWQDQIYLIAEAFGMDPDELDTDLMVGARVGLNIRSQKKDGKIDTIVDGIFPA